MENILKQEDALDKSPVKILAVDDREDNLLSIETILEQENYTLVKATSGRAALKILLQQQDFALILMDVQMPDMNGFETASLIYEREKLRHIPIIFITAHNQGEERMFEGYKMGGVDFIYKPINPELLRYKVSVFVELYQKTHQLLNHERKLLAANKKLAQEVEERTLKEEKIRLLNEQLLENNIQLKTTIEELDRFAYVASHDLQEPLRKILVFSDKLQTKYRDSLDTEVSQSLDKIAKASARMQSLINDLLKFSRQTTVNDDFIPISLDQLMQDVVADLEVEIERASAQVQVNALPEIWGIPSQVRQLFQNLLSNAIKFRKKDEIPVIRIYSESWNGLSKIIVQDNGIGFDPKYSEEIFMVFKRLHSYHEFEGSGVGLSICKKIIDKHNGSISAESKIDEGSKFIIEFPSIKLKTHTGVGIEIEKVNA
jgi:signal transduction histidine kinase